MDTFNYPLEQLVIIKKKRFDKALKLLEERKAILEKEQKILQQTEAERDKVLLHKKEKIKQMNEKLDAGTTSDKILEMKHYLEVVEERLQEKQKAVNNQQKKVDEAHKQVELAKKEMYQRKKDIEKLDMHKKEWKKDVHHWIEQQEAIQQDEIGSVKFTYRQKEQKKK